MAYQQYSGVFTNTQAAQAKGQDKWVGTSVVTPFAGDDDFESTTLLLQANGSDGDTNNGFIDSSDNTHTITRNGNVTQGSFSPFSQDEGKWGNYFDGSGDRLAIADDTSLDLGSGDFTLECWAFTNVPISSYSANYAHIFGKGNGIDSATYAVAFRQGSIAFRTPTIVLGTISVVENSWYHIAVTRESGTVRLFINGVLDVSTSLSTDFTNTKSFNIGDRESGDSFGQYPMNGYVSNLRVIKGTAVYTSNFTPSTTPLTDITNTSLLTCQSNRFVDNSSNAHSITVNGDTKVVPFSPFPIEGLYTPATHGSSAYFDGTGDYVQTPTDAALSSTLLANDFTIQAWLYLDTIPNACAIWTNSTSNSDGFSSSYVYSNGQLGTGKVGVNEFTSSTGIVKVKQWHHFALVRDGATVYMYLDGVQVATGAASTYLTTTTAKPMTFGRNFQTSPVGIDGYMSNIKVSNTAINFASVGVPTAPATSDANTELLLNFADAGIFDATRKNVLETVGDAQIDTAVKKFGTGSMQFDGTGDYLATPSDANFGFGTGDFTIEGWAFTSDNTRSVNGASQRIVDIGGGDVGVWLQSSTGYISYNAGNVTASSTVFPENQWNHFALTRSGSSLKLFLNGSEVASATNSNDLGSAHTATVGAYNNSSDGAFLGYIDDLRITKGVARYTANFTAPTEEFIGSNDYTATTEI